MYIKYFDCDVDELVAYPVMAFKVLAAEEGSSLDILGETIVPIIEKYKTYDAGFIMKKLSIPETYRGIVEGETAEIKNMGIFDGSFKTSYGRSTEQRIVYVLYDKINGKIIDEIIDEQAFDKRLIYGQKFENKVESAISYSPREKDKYIKEICTALDRYNRLVMGEEEGASEEDFRLGSSPLYFKEVLNISCPSDGHLLIQAYINKEGEIMYKNPFHGVDSVYFKKSIGEGIDEEVLKYSINKHYEDEFGGSEPSVEDGKEFVQLDFLEDEKVKEGYIEIQKGIAVLKQGIVKTQSNQVIIEMDKVMKRILDLTCGFFYKPYGEQKRTRLSYWIIREDYEKIFGPEILDQIINVEFDVESGISIKDTVPKKSIISYYLIFAGAAGICCCSTARQFLKLFEEKKNVLRCIEKIRKYRNNTAHSELETRHDNRYDLYMMTYERQLEVIEGLRDEIQNVCSEFAAVLKGR